jgi:hypothetical protein
LLLGASRRTEVDVAEPKLGGKDPVGRFFLSRLGDGEGQC